jgi:ABC-type transport system involved in multi-copper enzyme maturation permease subunit
MPYLAILRHDLRTLLGSWLVRIWLGGTVLLTLLVAMSNWQKVPTAPLIAMLLVPYLVFPWFLVVMVLGISPVSGARAEALADGFLSRPVTRYEYLLGAWSARVLVVLGVFLLVMVPAIWLITLWDRPASGAAVTLYGLIAALGVVGLVLTFQVSLAFFLGTLIRKPILTIVVLLFLWYPVNSVLHAFKVPEFSPISLSQAMPTLLQKPWREAEGASPGGLTEEQKQLEAMSRQAGEHFLAVLSGVPTKPQPDATPRFFDESPYKDFSLIRVLLGYGVPTLLSIGLATLCFSYRDL